MENKKILVVDDEEHFTAMVKLNLEDRGNYEVRTENKGSNALAAAKEFNPDIIILDVIMPDMAGGEVVQQLKAEELTKDIPIVFLTALVTKDEETAGQGIEGDNLYIAKPVTVERLIDFIENRINKK